MEKLFGSRLLSGKNKSMATGEALKEKPFVGVYFSAHWCPPCRRFTPELVEFYTKQQDLEVVFVSRDKSSDEMASYYASMPWLAVPFEESELRERLAAKYGVKGIPTLVVLDKDGKLITTDGRSGVSSSPEAFPWRQKSVAEMLPHDLADKPVFLYFSAHWCPPCRGFTPKLVTFYKQLKEKKDFEIVFVSSDKSQESFEEYASQMPWAKLPFSSRSDKEALSKAFDVSGIPSLILLGPEIDGERAVINKSARALVESGQDLESFPEGWKPKPYADISSTVDCGDSNINETPSIVVLAEHPGVQDRGAVVEAVKAAAMERAQSKDDGLLFFYATSDGGPVPRIRAVAAKAKQATAIPTMIKIDISLGVYYLSEAQTVTLDTINAFIADPGAPTQLGS